MNIQNITNILNEKLKNSELLYDFQKYRRDVKKIKNGSNLFFAKDQKKETYAFHYGGRSEVQFNIGIEDNIFRFGLGFSLQRDINIKKPMENTVPKIKKFNDYINKKTMSHKDCVMWRWSKEGRSPEVNIDQIPNNWIVKESFIFVGKYITKNVMDLTDTDLNHIVSTLEDLYPIYEFIELKQYKISRICWNSKMWIKPSGIEGKSINDTYERDNHFGHEEWLFDFDKLINGYHYAAIEPIGKHIDKYEYQLFDIRLYTYNSTTKKRYWVANIKDVRALPKDEREDVYKYYIKIGWLDQMRDDLIAVGANHEEVYKTSPFIFNIKFKPENVTFFNEGLKEITDKNVIKQNGNRYILIDERSNENKPKEKIKYEIIQNDISEEDLDDSITSITKKHSENPIEFKLLHRCIQNGFIGFLKKSYPNDTITKEAKITGINRIIDIFHETREGISIIYEVKSYKTINTSLRIAIGQMLEYAYYPNRTLKMKLVLVTHCLIPNEMKVYIKNIKDLHNLDIGIIYFDLETKNVLDTVNYELI